ncbi:hypothetical protein [Clostridium senegalense]
MMEVELGEIACLIEVVLWKLTFDNGQLTMLVESGSPLSFELLGTGFDLLVEKYKIRRASDVNEENKLIVPVPFVMEVEL